MMLDRGRVFKVERDLAWVEFAASSACAKCGACHAAASGKMVIEAENPIGACEGDVVEVEISQTAKVLVPFLVYGLPILLMLVGMTLGSFISERIGIIFGLIFLAAGFVMVRLIDRYAAKSGKFRAKIVRKQKKA